MATATDITNRIPITAALMLATLMFTLDSTIANVALPHMQGSISASQEQITWVLTSYILATVVMTPLSGWLSQKIGRKRMLLYSVVAFTAASMLCGIAANVPEMVAFRVLQGIAGASLMPLSQAVMLDIFTPDEVPRVMSLWSAAVILGPILGPTLGGWITEHLTWRWVFYINVPVGILAALGIYTFMAKDEGGRQRPFDALGFVSLTMFAAGLQVMLDRGPTQEWFDSKEIWIECAIAVAGLWMFVWQTATAKAPFFDRALARDRNFAGCTIFSFFVGVLVFSTSALLPSLMQNLLGYSPLDSGWAAMPRGIGSFISFLLVPSLVIRAGPRPVVLLGLVLTICGLWAMSKFDLMMTSRLIMISGFVQGLGTGLLFAPLATLSYATLSPVHRVEGTIMSTMARSLGSSIGISIVQSMVIRTGAFAHSVLAGGIDPSDPLVRDSLPATMDPSSSAGLATLEREVTRQASMIGYVDVFSWMTLMTICLIPLLLILRAAPPMARTPTAAHGD